MNSSSPKSLKAVKKKIRLKVSDVRQCRLCLRLISRGEVRETRTGNDIRRKILDAVEVKVTIYDKLTTVCVNCLRLVDIIYNFRQACRKTNTIHATKLLMLHPGDWGSEEKAETLENCQELVRKHRVEIDGLFNCTGLAEGGIDHMKGKEFVLQSKHPVQQVEEIDDSDPESSENWAQKLDAPVFRQPNINNNKITRHRDPYSKIVCEICGMMVGRRDAEHHQNKHLNVKPHSCPQEGCDVKFYSQFSRDRHLKKIHESAAEQFECEICHRKIKGEFGFKRHLLTHNGEDGGVRKAPCTICGKRFYRSYLKDHIAVHTGQIAHSCELCGHKYRARNNLLAHIKRVHKDCST